MTTVALDIAGEALQLLPQRALLWPRRSTLIVADVHLGKGAALRRAGLAVPAGSTQENLARLDALLQRWHPERLLVLGDLFHTGLPAGDPTLAAVSAFRQRHAALSIEVLRGNHDRALAMQPTDWRLRWHGDAVHEAPFVFRHTPASDARGTVLAGHVHPAVRLRTAQDALRLPAFWYSTDQRLVLLPAFGSLTGSYLVQPAAGDTVVVVTPDGLVALPAVRAASTRR